MEIKGCCEPLTLAWLAWDRVLTHALHAYMSMYTYWAVALRFIPCGLGLYEGHLLSPLVQHEVVSFVYYHIVLRWCLARELESTIEHAVSSGTMCGINEFSTSQSVASKICILVIYHIFAGEISIYYNLPVLTTNLNICSALRHGVGILRAVQVEI